MSVANVSDINAASPKSFDLIHQGLARSAKAPRTVRDAWISVRKVLVLAAACALVSACSPGRSSVPGGGAEKSTDTAQPAQKPADPLPTVPAAAPAGSPASTAPAVPPPQKTAPEAPAPKVDAPAPKVDAPPSSGSALAASPGAAAAAAAPATPPAPEFREVTIPAGRSISVTLSTPVASDTSKVEDAVHGTLAKPIVVSGTTVVPAGAELTGTVIGARQSGRVKGRASVAFRFERLIVRDETHDIRTAQITRQAAASNRGDLTKGGIGAGVGAIVGGIVGGGKGAAIGAGAGGAGAVLATRGNEIRLPAGTTVTTTLQQPLKLLVPVAEK